MIVALTVLALLMLIGGLAAMVQGIPFVRLEVGWTMVIAGTVGASAGAVLLGITAAVARLGRIERALAGHAPAARPAADLAAAETGAAPVRATRNEPVLSPVLPPIPFPAAPPPAPEPRPAEPTGLDGGTALAAGAAVAAAGLAASELRLTRAEDPDISAGRPDDSRQETASQESPHHAPAPYDPSPREPVAQEFTTPEQLSAHETVAHEPPMHDPAAHESAPPPPAEEPRPAPPHEAAPPPAPPAPEPVAEAPLPQEPPYEDLPPEEPPGKTVIGTYDSGGNTYTMYADGTIDADTPAGRFHFASIEELKVFRNAGGEGAARSA